jgi:uncharacterized membrane protein
MKRPQRLRRYFVTGLIVITPVGATWLVLQWIFRRLDSILGGPLAAILPVRVPGLGLFLLLLLILLVGWLAYQTAGRQLINWWDTILVRFPLTARIYRASSQIVQTLMGSQQRIVRRVVLIPFPTDGSWAVAFVTNEGSTVSGFPEGEYVNVFLPTTPNPTSGYMLMVHKDRIRNADLSVEEAMKLIISGGAVQQSTGPPQAAPAGLDLARLLLEADRTGRSPDSGGR